MSKFSISQYLAPDVEESDVDRIGRAVLIEQARAQGKRITGEVERIYDQYVVGVSEPGPDGSPVIKHVPLGSPPAEGRTAPDARMVTWQADAEPITADPAPSISGERGDDGKIHALLPRDVVEHGGMITFLHGLASDVLITAHAADGATVGYEFAIEVAPGEHQILLPSGVSHLQAEIDSENDQ